MSDAQTPGNQAEILDQEAKTPRLTTILIDALRKRSAPDQLKYNEIDLDLLELAENLPQAIRSGALELLANPQGDQRIFSNKHAQNFLSKLGIPNNASLVFLKKHHEYRFDFAVYLKAQGDHAAQNELRLELDLNPRAINAGLPGVFLYACRAQSFDSKRALMYQLSTATLRGILAALGNSPIYRIHYLAELRINAELAPFYFLFTGKPDDAQIQLLPFCIHLIEGQTPSLLARINPQELKLDQARGSLKVKTMETTLSIPAAGLGAGFFGPFALRGCASQAV